MHETPALRLREHGEAVGLPVPWPIQDRGFARGKALVHELETFLG